MRAAVARSVAAAKARVATPLFAVPERAAPAATTSAVAAPTRSRAEAIAAAAAAAAYMVVAEAEASPDLMPLLKQG